MVRSVQHKRFEEAERKKKEREKEAERNELR
jgi:hypothetical protein